MDAVLLCMKKRGIRFFNKIQFNNTKIQKYHEKKSFLEHLRVNKQNAENVLIMAHGSNGAILTTTRNPSHPFTTYISSKDVDAFYNDFVFAVSCLTANEFGQKCIENGTRTYLGYQIEIGPFFKVSLSNRTQIPKRIINTIDTVVKHIFVEVLAEAYEDFLMNPISVETFRELFSFLLEKRISSLVDINIETLYREYGIKIVSRHYEKYITSIVLYVLSCLNDVLSKLICLGEKSYISPTFVQYYCAKMNYDKLMLELKNSEDFINASIKNQEEILAIIKDS
ncbi:MAG: hypothetical protein IK108_10115 [Clostridia bacterium]|nr:hypothetical protein [Clostridia bacterium]